LQGSSRSVLQAEGPDLPIFAKALDKPLKYLPEYEKTLEASI